MRVSLASQRRANFAFQINFCQPHNGGGTSVGSCNSRRMDLWKILLLRGINCVKSGRSVTIRLYVRRSNSLTASLATYILI